MTLFRVRRLTCEQVVNLVTDYVEGALSSADRRRFEAHLSGCPHCTEFLAQIRKTIALTGCITVPGMTPDLERDFIALFRRWQVEAC